MKKRRMEVSNIGGLHKIREVGTPLPIMNFFMFIFALISILKALKEISEHEYLACSH